MRDRSHRKILYRPLDFVLLRAPLLPIESYLALGKPTIPQSGSSTPTLIDPQVRRALAIGAPSLLEGLERASAHDKKAVQLTSKLRRFLIRMSTRPTPYGTFAGVALAGWGQHTDVLLAGPPQTRTRVDMDWLVRYVLDLNTTPAVRQQLRWFANSSAWTRNGRVFLSGNQPSGHGSQGTVSIAATPVVRRVLELARAPVAYPELLEQLVATTPSATPGKAERLLNELWQHGFLRTELMPPLTVEEPMTWVRDRLRPIAAGKALNVQLDALSRTIDACDTVPVDQGPSALRKATTHLSLLGPTQTEMPLQVDMTFALGGRHLSSAIGREAAHAADLLLRLTPAPNGPALVEGYRQVFLGKYGVNREVPLLELVDSDWGLGPIGRHNPGWTGDAQRLASRSETLQALALSAIRDGQLCIELDDQLISRLSIRDLAEVNLPTSIDLNVFVLASSCAAIDEGDFQVMVGPNVGAQEAGRNLARFVPCLGPEARTALEGAARRDEEFTPDWITAEVVYLPTNFRIANVVVRPGVRYYEAVHGVTPGVSPPYVVPLNELVVGVRQSRFYVRWPRRDVVVRFAAGHMLNSNQAPPECSFLTEITHDGIARLSGFDWGPAGTFDFLPRVQAGRAILHCAQWRLRGAPGKDIPVENAKAFGAWFAAWRKHWRVPRRVYLSYADNRLLYDLDDPAQVDDLRRELRRETIRGQGLLQEALPGPEHAWLPSADGGHHIAELVVSLGLDARPAGRAGAADQQKLHSSPMIGSDVRVRPPGSDWLYLKIYAPRSGQNELLAGPVRSLCDEVQESQLADGWFFVRYADPRPHLRLRFHGSPRRLTEVLFPRLCDWASGLVAQGRCSEFTFDTYEREVERYGGPDAMTIAEELFAADSRAVVKLIDSGLSADSVVLGVVTVDDLLEALNVDEPSRVAWLKQTVTSRKETGAEYRTMRDMLVTALRDPSQVDASVREALASRRAAVSSVAAQLGQLDIKGVLSQPLSRLYESYVHMHLNRLWGDPSAERRALGLLLRTRDTISHQAATVPRDPQPEPAA
ncbi:lantibiotic dehydratase [Mycobacterium sp. OTB74]|uniref:lantibiotic dehydratase n=1 Tax=Mycobacterium sp. OTB74 TaxID=1853452 RepID=UPI002472F9C7|nr:lantibiotic dehydratase [Mycobacterium sp. OTB74]MDH6246092.1 thiopeptide-type bacteriocin biosynthesis protein [Mycobacterium sp. OTB74]